MDDEAYILALTIRTELVPPANPRLGTQTRQEKMRAKKIPFSPSSPWAEAQMKPNNKGK
jgi:hypothetical protein